MELSEGLAIGPYRLVSRAGSGGMAEVWRAYDARLNRYVAIKFLSPRYATDRQYLERFRHEAQAISRLDHPNILLIHDFGEQDGWTYMVSPYIGGGTLEARLHRGAWSVDDALAVLEPLASALDYAHAQGIVHRDVKPSNVLFTEQGRLVLSDFGVARMLEASSLLSQAGLVVGTPMYMSPEQAEAVPATGASDRYSLGIIAYEMLTGRPPFMAETPLALLRAHVDKPLPPPRALNPALSEAVEGTLFTMLAKSPADRFPTGQAFTTALQAATRETAPTPGPRPPRALTDPTLPLTPDRETRGGSGQRAADVARPAPPTRPTIPVPPTLPLAPTVAVRPDLRTGLVAGWLVPLAIITAASCLGWFVLLLMRVRQFEAVLTFLASSDVMDAGSWLAARALTAAFVGLVLGGGLAAALSWIGVRPEPQGWAKMVLGWVLAYAVVHTAVYLVVRAWSLDDALAIDDWLSWWNPTRTTSALIMAARLIDVLPAAFGGVALARLLDSADRDLLVRLALVWAVAAVLAVLAVSFVTSPYSGGALDELTSGPRRFALVAGLAAGVVQGIVGGWLTVRSLRGSGPRPGYDIGAPQ